MKKFFNKIKLYVSAHKTLSVFILIIILLVGYWGYKKITNTSGETRYVLSAVTKGTIISSVAGTGQVSASNQIDLKPSVSGSITYVGVKPGDQVKSGEHLFSLDNKDAQKTVRDAETNLQSAQIALAKLQEPADKVSLLQYQNAIAQAQENKKNQELAVQNAYSNYLNNGLQAVPTNTTGSNINFTAPTITGTYTGSTEGNYYISIHGSGGNAYFAVSGLENTTGFMTTGAAIPLGSLGLYIQFPNNYTNSGINQLTIQIPNKQSNGYGSSYNAYQSALQNQQQVNTDSDRTIASNTESLNKLQAGADPLDIQSSQLNITQKENALADAKQTLSDYYITAPFSGIIASVPVEVGEDASSGTILGTIITSKKIATVSLNEVDVAKIALGQKVTLTFDAIPDLTISGKVVEIDSVGTVAQGVVSYNVKISFDTDDSRVKPGMSVSAEIITNVKQDILLVPNSAVKNQSGSSYVEMFDTELPAPIAGVQGSPSLVLPKQQNVEVGISDNTSTEIISGLKDGDKIVSKTIISTTKTSSTPSILNAATGNRAGGGAPLR